MNRQAHEVAGGRTSRFYLAAMSDSMASIEAVKPALGPTKPERNSMRLDESNREVQTNRHIVAPNRRYERVRDEVPLDLQEPRAVEGSAKGLDLERRQDP